MKTFLVLCTAASLTGCAVYPAPGYDTYGNAGAPPYVVERPVYLYGGGTVYRSDAYPYQRPWGYHRPPSPPPVIVVPGPLPHPGRPFMHGPRPGRGNGDRDGDGIPNRVDRDRNHNGVPNRMDRSRDRDGDGISNRMDPRPDIPNRR